MNRRGFLTSLAAAGLGANTISSCAPAAAIGGGRSRLDRIGVQLYTIRSQMQSDAAQTLAAVAGMGYREVETAGLYGLMPDQFRAALDRVGLVSPAGHYGLGAIRQDMEATFATARTLGQQWVIVPSLDGADRTREGYRRVADEMNRFATAARERGLRFGYHNHDFEFATLEGGENGYDLLLAGTDPALVDMELDLFWAVRGGRDPVSLFEQHSGRFPLCHVKDMRDMQGARQMVDVGSGEIDFARIFAYAERAGLRHYFVEHDNPDDALASIRASYQYLRELLF